MRRIVAVALILLLAAVGVGIVVPAIYQARRAEEFRRCQNNLRQLGAFGLFHATLPGEPLPVKAAENIPAGTVVNLLLPPDERLSWYLPTLPALEHGSPELGAAVKRPQVDEFIKEVDVSKAWDADGNRRLAQTRLVVALCPAQNPTAGDDRLALTSYLGNGGLGPNTAALTLELAGNRAGTFRYDSPTPLAAIGDGISNSILLVESNYNLGPWLRGGPSTIRSLAPDEPPYLGPGRLYSGCHIGRGNFSMADGSVRVITNRMDSAVFRALLTINGGEKELDFDKEP